MRRGVATVLLAVAALSLVVAGCGPTGQASPTPTVAVDTHPSTPPPFSPSATPTPSPTPTVETDADAKKHAYDRMLAYYKLRDQLGQDPSLSLDLWKTVAKGEPYKAWRDVLDADRKSGTRQVGFGKVTRAIVSDPATTSGRPTIKISACLDYTGVHLVDKNGKAMPHGTKGPFDLTLQRYDDDWYVTLERDGTRSC